MVLGKFIVKIAVLFVPFFKEVYELLRQWEQDFLFDCSKFNMGLHEFKTTSLREVISYILDEN